ncbi:MAG: ubiquinone/menaquinone biosynthesis methyltransferase, partial [Alistipes sp.]|nr:ubiquinone/menaquinone biosynthesis methyltransferase [Alistipes sp.]
MKPYNQEQTKKQQVEQMFDNIASTYDGLNHILSFNIDRLWRRRVVRIVRGTGAKRIMDMATGTGDLAIAMAKRIPGSHILGVDLSRKMLDVAQNKIRRQGLDERIILQHGDAERLDAVASESLDAVTVAFGVRNFDDLAGGLQQIHRTIRPGGTLVVLEFSTPRNRAIRW